METTHDVVEFLKTGEFMVTFAKAKTGERRVIVGSLPADAHAKNDDTVPILETSTGLWKSFRLDCLISIAPARLP